MAFKTVFLAVVSKRDVAVFAFGDVTAVTAQNRSRISAPVQKYYCLVSARKCFRKLFPQRRGKRRVVPALYFLAHICDYNFGKGFFVYALRQGYQTRFAFYGFYIAFD